MYVHVVLYVALCSNMSLLSRNWRSSRRIKIITLKMPTKQVGTTATTKAATEQVAEAHTCGRQSTLRRNCRRNGQETSSPYCQLNKWVLVVLVVLLPLKQLRALLLLLPASKWVVLLLPLK